MKTLYFDLTSGICGDMVLAAFIDLGVSKDYINDILSKLNLPEAPKVTIKKEKGGFGGITSTVEYNEKDAKHRNYNEICEIIKSADIDNAIKKKALELFDVIAKAESKVHGVPVEKIHFHEVGAVDSIADIVGACACFNFVGAREIYFSRIPFGSGTVKSAHGILPLPAPAVSIMLENLPVYGIDINKETVTPTGAAIIKVFAKDFCSFPPMILEKTGQGLAKNKLEGLPGMLRIFQGKQNVQNEERVFVIDTNIDNFNPEFFSHIQDILFKEGALDVTITPILMKKGRPANTLSVISKTDDLDKLSSLILKHTSSIGLRYYEVGRKKLKRESVTIETPYGKIAAKKVYSPSKTLILPEYEELKRISLETDKPIHLLQFEIFNLANS